MNILITGGTGKICDELGRELVKLGHHLTVMTRSVKNNIGRLSFPSEWLEHDLVQNEIPMETLAQFDVIYHFMGESVDDYWNVKKKERIFESRVQSSKHLADSIRKVYAKNQRLKTVISASAQAVYGNPGEVEQTESMADRLFESQTDDPTQFLQDVCLKWELPFRHLSQELNLRTVQLRIPVVLDSQFGALKKMLPIFQRGIGAPLGTGQQWMSWISLQDLVRISLFALDHHALSGPVNCCSEIPVRNKDFTQALARALGVITFPTVPNAILQLMFGEMSQIITSSIKMKPTQLIKHGFKFEHSELEEFFNQHLKPMKNFSSLLVRKQFIPLKKEKVFEFFSDAKNLEKITPSYLNFKVLSTSTPSIESGTKIQYKLKLHQLPLSWTTLILNWKPPFEFTDQQEKGPYTVWHHTHRFEDLADGTLMIDEVKYKVPIGWLGYFVAQPFVQSDVEGIFSYRAKVIAEMYNEKR